MQKFISFFCRNIDPLFMRADKFIYKSVAVSLINCQKYDYAFIQRFNVSQLMSLTMNIFQVYLKLLLLGQFFCSEWKCEGNRHEREVEVKKELSDKAMGSVTEESYSMLSRYKWLEWEKITDILDKKPDIAVRSNESTACWIWQDYS
jgi:hypothetical protein